MDVRRVGEQLGVRYVLEGSVRMAEERVRITAQLVDAASGEHLWARRYDRELKDIFALQDEITRNIATELEVKLVEGERARVWRRTTNDLEAYDLALRGRDLYLRQNRADLARGRRFIEKALELDPRFGYAMYLLGWTYVVEGMSGWSESPEACFDHAIELGSKAIALDDHLGEGYTLLGSAFMKKGDHDRAVEYGERGFNLNPDDSDANGVLAYILGNVGRPEEALQRMESAMRLNPFPQGFYLGNLGGIYRSLGRIQDAIATFRICLERIPDHFPAQIGLTLAYMEAGREEEGRAQARHVLRIAPGFSSSSDTYLVQYKDPEERKRLAALLRKAGLPE
jgi:adenylate cyclase